MSRVFHRKGDRIRAEFAPEEVELLRHLQEGVRSALAGNDPSDAVQARLFPAAVTGDARADEELRAMLRDDLLASRQAGLDALVAILDRCEPHRGRLRVELTADEPMLVLGVLNDVRLAIGARVGIEELERDEVAADDPAAYRLAIMDYLGWWQEQLLELLDPTEPPSTPDPWS